MTNFRAIAIGIQQEAANQLLVGLLAASHTLAAASPQRAAGSLAQIEAARRLEAELEGATADLEVERFLE